MDKAYAHRVGTHLSWLRKQKKLTQEQLAARMQLLGCDMTRSALAKIEVGQRMSAPTRSKPSAPPSPSPTTTFFFRGALTQLRIRILRCPDRRQ